MKTVAAMAVGMILLAAPVMAQEGAPASGSGAGSAASTNMDIFVQKLKADKKLLVATNMDLTEAEGKKFWPLYDAYQKELEQINQRLGRTIKTYADAYNAGQGTVPGETARKLMNETLGVEEAEVRLKRTYAHKIGKVLSSAKTARYLQIETKIRSVIKAELAKEIPLIY